MFGWKTFDGKNAAAGMGFCLVDGADGCIPSRLGNIAQGSWLTSFTGDFCNAVL